MVIDYSVVIRTTGKAHEKYQALLESISKLVPAPKEVIVVLPEGADVPDEKLGWESFYFCKRGMVSQRMKGVQVCKTHYALFCDDDVSFSSDFVRLLFEPIEQNLSSFSVAPLYSFLPQKGINSLANTVMASAAPMVFQTKSHYISVLKSSGYSYNRNLQTKSGKFYYAESAPWTCFFADIDAFRSLDFEKETWLDKNGYSSLDDQTMFYKAWLMGLKTVAVPQASYKHLDGRTSFINNKPSVVYSKVFNRVVFWHRFIYSRQNNIFDRISSTVAFRYCIFWLLLWNEIAYIRGRMPADINQLSKAAYRDALKYIESEEYHNLPQY